VGWGLAPHATFKCVAYAHVKLGGKGQKRKLSERLHYDQATMIVISKYALINGDNITVESF